jgi:hypothetical protein
MNITQGFGQALSSNTGLLCEDNSQPTLNPTKPLPFEPTAKPKPDFESFIDWLSGTCTTTRNQYDCIKGEITSIFKDCWDTEDNPKFSGRKFAHSLRSPKGGWIAWNFLDGGCVDWWISIPATMLKCCPTYLLRRFISMLLKMNFNPTRLDLTIDDYTKSLTPGLFKQAIRDNHHHGFKKASGFADISPNDESESGWTIYLGKSGQWRSDKVYRFYNKAVESKGEVDAYRLEGQFTKGYCKGILEYLNRCQTDKEFLSMIANICVNGIDFYEGTQCRDDFKRLEWWQEFKDKVGATDFKVSAGSVKSTLDRTMTWIEKSVERSLATIEKYYQGLGMDFPEWLYARIEAGRNKIRSFHDTQVKSALLQLGICDSVSYEDIINGYF